MIKSVLVSVLMAATTTTAEVHDDNPGRIFDGTDAEPGDYPYYVGMGGLCGGTLIAPDIVLYAASCGNYKNSILNIGDYTETQFSQERICTGCITDPKFGSEGSFLNYDFALCKLNEPVFIDESNVILELNNNDALPKEGKNLIVIGSGFTDTSGTPSNSVQSLKVQALSNDQCKQDEYYYYNEITDNVLCAGTQSAGRPAKGDSGGPLVRRKKNDDGTFTDTLVGVVSFGKRGFYARTSKRADWIRETSCNALGSSASWCDDIPGPLRDCTDEGLIPLIVKVTTDYLSYETSWRVLDSNKEDIYQEQCFMDLVETTTTVCVEPDECYRFIIEDSYGDGMNSCDATPNCGSYSLNLNYGEEFIVERGNFLEERMTLLCTGAGVPEFCPNDKGWFRFNAEYSSIKNCTNFMAVGTETKRRKKCKNEYHGKQGSYWCPDTCGEVGIGDCRKKSRQKN